jgi:thiol-disulfide isomerase/thioredoxin
MCFSTRRYGAVGLAALSLGFLLAIAQARADATAELERLRGRVVWLDFWASWCAPCRQSFPWMQKMTEMHGAEGLTVLAVDVDANRDDAERFLKRFSPTFTVEFDPKGELPEAYRVKAMPTSFLIDRHGTIRYTHRGFLPADLAGYETQIRELLAEK